MTSSEFYKKRRPELFSDSEIVTQVELPREILSYELSTISTNQKQDEFETLCRRLAEKFISPNLIPQVGPTGGGDGKTDSETYPVSKKISDRWFTPENGWNKEENWAFAISAKEVWKGKVKSDIKKIVETNRGYSRVYFMSNQLISSKKKKDAQDEFIKEFNIDVVIIDREWILEKIYNNDLIDLVVDSLNLSTVYKNKEIKLGSNDAYRLQELENLEKNISDTNRYSEYDFQLVEDALESAILSRMLEKPRDEVEGKFDRALRFCKKLNNTRQLMRIYYQRAWTYINWYDDYVLFLEDYKSFKTFISKESNMSEIEDYFTLFTLLYSLKALGQCNLEDLDIDIKIEKKDINNILRDIISDGSRPTSSLMAKTHILFLNLLCHEADINKSLIELSKIIEQSKSHLDYPFEITRQIIEETFSELFPNNEEFDNLIDILASISAKRSSELDAGQIFLRRAIKKLESKSYKDSIVYFGKSIVKLAKEETQDYMYFSLLGLGMAYKNLGLIWASNNCYITACQLSFKLSNEKGIFSEKTYQVLKEILTNELFIGRIPYILTWHEMFLIFHKTMNIDESEEEVPFSALYDGTFSTRLINTENIICDKLQYMPDILEKQELYLSQSTVLYKQGYIDMIMSDYKISNEEELDEYFKKISNQPFVEQILYETNFMSDEKLSIYSNILGCKFQINFFKDIEMFLVAETLLAFFEGFMGTSLSSIHSHRESVVVNIIKNEANSNVYFTYDEDSYEYSFFSINFAEVEENSNSIWNTIMGFIADILARNFLMNNIEEHFVRLFEKEEVHERLSLILGYRNSLLDILGDKPKLFFDDWVNYYKPNQHIMKRENPISFNYEKLTKDDPTKYKKEDISHNKIKTHTIIDMPVWDRAKWKGFGFILDPLQGLGVFLAFEDAISAKNIFDRWINRFGHIDKKELINITIIKGINKEHPYWYKVMVTINAKALNLSQSEQLFQIPSRFHQMEPNSSKNLDNLIYGIKGFKKYTLFPAVMDKDNKVEPLLDKGIIKTSLTIKNAWEIGKHDLECIVIQESDNPIIPNEHKEDAPILSILKMIK